MRYTILALTVVLCLAFVSSNPIPESGLSWETASSENSPSWGEQKPIIGPTKGMTMAIPGPWTRLLLIGNRGLAQVVEDIIIVSK
ncbi:hypothetical protein EAG_09496 [Camponotus floridanus]|uniref:Uncharacterized protein n=1 Tax=Camponotus floridanus TaxID=104421 RepID=E1ZZ64_CAMFO|nr:hypothetical protein EAG_09496 [Camponotus floridanus]